MRQVTSFCMDYWNCSYFPALTWEEYKAGNKEGVAVRHVLWGSVLIVSCLICGL